MDRPPTLADLGEFGLIARIARTLGAPPPPAGPGDDAAVVPAPDGRVVISTDLLAEGVHFRWDWSSPQDVGAKAAAVNLADIAAMGAVPTALLVGLAIRPGSDVAVADGIADGLRDECARVGAVVVGGDTIRSPGGLLLAITALGDLQGRAPVTRNGARSGDDVLLVGRIGWAAAGLALLAAGIDAFPDLVAAHRRPRPPYAAGPLLAQAGAHALCDVSDGLVADAGHLAAASGVAFHLESAATTDAALDAARARVGGDPRWELTGGEDHALVAAVPAGVRVAGARRIGTVRSGSGVHIDEVLAAQALSGHDHFREDAG